MKVTRSVESLVNEALQVVTTLTTTQVREAKDKPGLLLIDLRDIREVKREGRIPGSLHIPRGMLEFWVDPESPYYKPEFDHVDEVILYCNKGWRSALAAQTMHNMGIEGVAHMAGGMTQWVADSFEVEQLPSRT